MTVLRSVAVVIGGFASLLAVGGPPPPPRALTLRQVVPGAVISQGFGCTSLELEPVDIDCPAGHFHTGVDLAAPSGRPVFSATSGIAGTGWDPQGFGNYVVVRVDAASTIYYGHLLAVMVTAGAPVVAGDPIGSVGATGLATGPHVHFEIRRQGRPVDPMLWLQSVP